MRFLSFLLFLASAFAQTNFFLLPSASSQTPVITPIRIDPFSAATAFPAQPSASFFFVNADGTKYYSVARAATDTVLVLSAASPSTVLKRHNLTPAEAAAITPDRRRLLVVANGLHIIDTASDNILSSITDVGTEPIDVAVALDASRAFVLSSTSNRLTAVDLTTNATVGNPITIPGICTGVAVGPNGLIYVTATNRVYEIDGRFMTIRTEFPVNALPGKIVFTPGGRYGVMINQTPATGSAVTSIELPTGIIAVASPTVPVILNTLTVASAGRIYATSNQTRALYEILVEPLRIRTATFPNIASPTNVVAVATTNEWLNPNYVLVATSNSILRMNNGDLPPEGAGGFSIPSAPGNLVFAAPGVTGQPAVITSYNVDQTTAPGTTYLPLVTRVFTFSGRPIYGVPVTFTSEDPTAIISAPTVITNYEGYALTSVTAPGNAASFSVTALTGTRGSPQTGFGLQTGGGIPTDTLTIRGGQGQVVQEQFKLREPMVVQVRDAQGRPAVGRTITFAIRTGSGTFNTTTADGTVLTGVACVANVCTARTDIDGRAAVGFIATSTASGSSFSQQTISATDGLRTVIFTVTTLLGQTLGGAAASPPLVQRLAPTGNLITGTVGTTVLDAIRVRFVVVSGPQAGQGIPNVSLRALTGNLPTAGPTADCSAVTDFTGAVTCNLVLGPVGGVAPLAVIIGGSLSLSGPSLSLDVRGGPAVTNRAPFSSQGTNQTLTFNVLHPDGIARLGIINLLMNTSLDARNACYLAYSVPQRVLYLVNDGGPTGGLSPGILLGSPNTGSVANTQCRIFAEGSSAVSNGNSLTLSFNASFNESFAGSKVIYLAARTTDELTQGWAPYGVHEVPIPNPAFPNSSAVNPGSGVTTTRTVTFNYRDAADSANLQTLWGLTNASLDARSACYFAYHAPSNTLFLFPDDGNGTLATSINLTDLNSIENSQCRISAIGSTVNRSGNSLTLTLNITYKPAFAGPKIIWTAASTLANAVSPWKASGAWLVPMF